MTEKIKKVKKICECKHCGNEAEMLVTCTMTDLEEDTGTAESESENPMHAHQVKGSATCSHCGNEADMWVDMP
jgi:transcription elongation factor Elf1